MATHSILNSPKNSVIEPGANNKLLNRYSVDPIQWNFQWNAQLIRYLRNFHFLKKGKYVLKLIEEAYSQFIVPNQEP